MHHNLSHHSRNQQARLIISLSALVGFLLLTFSRSSFRSIDSSGNSWAITIQNNSFTEVAAIISVVFDTNVLLLLSLGVGALLFYRNFRRHSLVLLGAMAGNALLVLASKTLVLSPRPANGLITETGYSFPSGHVTGGLVFFGLLTYFAWHICNSAKGRKVSITLFLAIITLVGFDRIYLNVHWVSDVLGGYLLGTFWLTLSIMVLKQWESNKNFKFSTTTPQEEHAPSPKTDKPQFPIDQL
jgi:membrane-associated phospholipid phosphatase